MTAYFIVRAEVDPAARDRSDARYENERLPDPVKAFGAKGASRGGSDMEDNVHIAFTNSRIRKR